MNEDDARTDLRYVRILHLTATHGERADEAALTALLRAGAVARYGTVRERTRRAVTRAGALDVVIGAPDRKRYDRPLGSLAAAAAARERCDERRHRSRGGAELRLQGPRIPGF